MVLQLLLFGLAASVPFAHVLANTSAGSALYHTRQQHGTACIVHVLSSTGTDEGVQNQLLTNFHAMSTQEQLFALVREVDRHEGRLIGIIEA